MQLSDRSPSGVPLFLALHLPLLWCKPEYRGFGWILGRKATWSRYLGRSWAIALAVAGAISLRNSIIWWICQRRMSPWFDDDTVASCNGWQHRGKRQLKWVVPGTWWHHEDDHHLMMRTSGESHLWQELSQTVQGEWELCPGESKVTLEQIWGKFRIGTGRAESEEDWKRLKIAHVSFVQSSISRRRPMTSFLGQLHAFRN